MKYLDKLAIVSPAARRKAAAMRQKRPSTATAHASKPQPSGIRSAMVDPTKTVYLTGGYADGTREPPRRSSSATMGSGAKRTASVSLSASQMASQSQQQGCEGAETLGTMQHQVGTSHPRITIAKATLPIFALPHG